MNWDAIGSMAEQFTFARFLEFVESRDTDMDIDLKEADRCFPCSDPLMYKSNN